MAEKKKVSTATPRRLSRAASSAAPAATTRRRRPHPTTCITRRRLENLISRHLGARWAEDAATSIYFGDDEYYVPNEDEAIAIIRSGQPLFATWTPEIFDCDDFSFVLKGHFCRAAVRHGRHRFAHCFGIVWKKKPEEHAMNWIVYRDLRAKTKRGRQKFVFGLVEPQWFTNPAFQMIRPVAETDGDFYFVTA